MTVAPPSSASVTPAPIKNNTWYRTTSSRTVVVFLHGLNSNTMECWRHAKTRTFWPDLIAADPLFENPSIFLAGYDTGFGAGRFDVPDATKSVFAALTTPPSPAQRTALDHDRLLFVCHSQGGIIARRMLTRRADDFRNKLIGLALFGSPSWGSRYANVLFPVMKLLGHRQAQQLRRDDPALVDLDSDFQELLDSKKLNIVGHAWVETRGFIRGMMRVVREESATRYFPWQRIPRVSHTAIVKPDSNSHASHVALRAFALAKGFCTRRQLREAVQKVQTAMSDVIEAFDTSSPRGEAQQAKAVADLVSRTAAARDALDRIDRTLPLDELINAPLTQAGSAWAYYSLTRERFTAISQQFDHFVNESGTNQTC